MSGPAARNLGGDHPVGLARGGRSGAELILVAAHHACDLRDLEVASRLLVSAKLILAAPDRLPTQVWRRAFAGLVAAHERLWVLKQPDS
jgi:hypothetical protein